MMLINESFKTTVVGKSTISTKLTNFSKKMDDLLSHTAIESNHHPEVNSFNKQIKG